MPAQAAARALADTGVHLHVEQGVPGLIDGLSRALAPQHAFLRAAWFRAGGAEATLLAAAGDGTPVAAFPTAVTGPAALGARTIVGAYWPFRMPTISPALDDEWMETLLGDRAFRSAMGPFWRVGPFYADDPAGARLVDVAPRAGWTVLTRRLGTAFVIDADAHRRAGSWPRPSSLKKLRALERRLGNVSYERIAGPAWTPAVFDTLARIERASWIAKDTDGTGAKFISASSRSFWEEVARDPVIGAMLSALILRVDGRPVAFAFDLNVAGCQHAIAATFDAESADHSPGKLVTYRGIEWALERGITRFDWGAGDSGYKRAFGAEAGPDIIDCLFVRSAFVARMLRSRWENAAREAEGQDARTLPLGQREWLLLASLATAAAAGVLAE